MAHVDPGIYDNQRERQPVLVRIKPETALPFDKVKDCQVTAQLGNVFGCFVTLPAVEQLKKFRNVISIEASL